MRRRAVDLMKEGMTLFLEGVDDAAGIRRSSGRSRTAARVATAWHQDLLAGYRQDPGAILSPIAARSTEDLIAARDLAFSSMCKHHLLPFSGKTHIAYAPDGKITGLSRLARLVDCLSRRLQLQETLTREIADAVQEHLAPAGAACIIEAAHACMTMRGSRKTEGRIVTVAFTGKYRRDPKERREVMAVLGFGPGRRL